MNTTKNSNKKNPATIQKPAGEKVVNAEIEKKPTRKHLTEEQKKARRERDAKRRVEKAELDLCAVEFDFKVCGVKKVFAPLYCEIMRHVFHVVSNEMKTVLGAFDETFKSRIGSVKKSVKK